MGDLTELCFGSGNHHLFTSPTECSGRFNMWLYKQEVHSDYFVKLASCISLHNRDGNLVKLELMEMSKFVEVAADTHTSTALLMLEALAGRLPAYTVPPQRPPTPPPPEPEPVPLYSEEERAMQEAALQAELAARRRAQAGDEKEEEEEEEED
eukprot:NODE_5821_length_549_cov_81.302000_g5078_i0.p1 GENE.NODE_5821_length_549_cov_81.302000_g5078_i0~~NODE_5821_length_549_cov_81.302000_g5078_i0.p1  ORF type:complete len:160 (-),score=72.56 NODE_5821_length_549_cov_81.302000_g5078_i0:70-528(-)